MQNTIGRLLVKGELANETVKYDRKGKAYVMKQSPRGVL